MSLRMGEFPWTPFGITCGLIIGICFALQIWLRPILAPKTDPFEEVHMLKDMTEDMTPEDERAHYWYTGRCKHCGVESRWVVDPQSMSPASFYRVVNTSYFPEWITFCEKCENQVVFELTARGVVVERSEEEG